MSAEIQDDYFENSRKFGSRGIVLPGILGRFKKSFIAPRIFKLLKNYEFYCPKVEGRILDLGFGEGSFLDYCGKDRVTGVELLDKEVMKRKKMGFSVIKHDLNHTPLPLEDNSFDLVYCAHVIEHLREPEALVMETHRVLRGGGKAVFLAPDITRLRTFYDDYTHIRPFTLMGATRLFADHGFEIETAGYGCFPGRFPHLMLLTSALLWAAVILPKPASQLIMRKIMPFFSFEFYVIARKT